MAMILKSTFELSLYGCVGVRFVPRPFSSIRNIMGLETLAGLLVDQLY